MGEENTSKKYWYLTWWGILIMVVGGIFLITACFFSFNVWRFYKMIKSGQGAELEQKYNPVYQIDPQTAMLRLELESGDHPYLGGKDVPVIIVAFLDYKCPYCADEAPILYKLGQLYGNKVRIIIRDFPSESLHPGATEVAKWMHCAYRMGFYWPAYNWIFNNQDALPVTASDDEASNFAAEFGADNDKFLSCIHSSEVTTEINKSFSDGYRYGVRGTPTFFVNGEQTQGAIDYKIWEGYIESFGD